MSTAVLYRLIAVSVLLAMGPLWLYLTTEPDAQRPELAELKIEGCLDTGGWQARWPSSVPERSILLARSYNCASTMLHVVVGWSPATGQGSELISKGVQPFPFEWRRFVANTGFLSLQLGGETYDVDLVDLRAPFLEAESVTWYRIGDRTVTDPKVGKVVGAWDALLGRSTVTTLHYAAVEGDPGAHRDLLQLASGRLAEATNNWHD